MMNIKNIYDLKKYWQYLKDKIITYYEGDWLVSTENSYDNTIQLNNQLFTELRNQNWLRYLNCTISHRSVSNYKFYPIDWNELDGLLREYQKLIKLVANKKFRQKQELEEFLLEHDYQMYNAFVIDYRSYWGGTRDEKALKIKHNGYEFYVPYGTSYKDNLSQKNSLSKALLLSYCKLLNIPYLVVSDYKCDTWNEKINKYRGFYRNLCKRIESGSWSDKFLEHAFKEERELLQNTVQ